MSANCSGATTCGKKNSSSTTPRKVARAWLQKGSEGLRNLQWSWLTRKPIGFCKVVFNQKEAACWLLFRCSPPFAEVCALQRFVVRRSGSNDNRWWASQGGNSAWQSSRACGAAIRDERRVQYAPSNFLGGGRLSNRATSDSSPPVIVTTTESDDSEPQSGNCQWSVVNAALIAQQVGSWAANLHSGCWQSLTVRLSQWPQPEGLGWSDESLVDTEDSEVLRLNVSGEAPRRAAGGAGQPNVRGGAVWNLPVAPFAQTGPVCASLEFY